LKAERQTNLKIKLKSLAALKVATIAGIVTTALAGLPYWSGLALIVLLRLAHRYHSSGPHEFRNFFILFAGAPIFIGILSFIVVGLSCLLYNWLSPIFGEIEIDLTARSEVDAEESVR